jgi:hypothetical protein
VFDEKCFIILILNFNTSGGLELKKSNRQFGKYSDEYGGMEE